MQDIIDVASNVGAHAFQLAEAGVKCVIRYYNHSNSDRLPTKCLTGSEISALWEAGLSTAVVFQQRGGAWGHVEDFSGASGNRDAKRALELAKDIKQPLRSGIYFAVDFDYFRDDDLESIRTYFKAVNDTIGDRFRIGIYGSGAVARFLKALNLVSLVWLSGSTGWTGTNEELEAGRWTLFQKETGKISPLGFGYDGNIFNPADADFGQFFPTVCKYP